LASARLCDQAKFHGLVHHSLYGLKYFIDGL
jgi:hypothetical protein